MNSEHQIYELTEAQRKVLMGEPMPEHGDGYDEEQIALLREDVARLDGYLKGRADSDKAQMSRPNSDDTFGVAWEKPDGRGGWISEASCWVEGCHVRIEGYDREEVERLMRDHQGAFHGN